MLKQVYNVIGVMSGTSMDGIDLAHIKFQSKQSWGFKLLECVTVPYSAYWKKKLDHLTSLNPLKLEELDKAYTNYLGQAILNFISKNNLKSIDAVCSHGHTAIHQPKIGLTYQMGNKSVLSNLINQTVVCDFRVQDVKLGGQGAPLVPIGDQLLFPDHDFCLNLGGFANVSFDDNGRRIAFDICPVNIVLNVYSKIKGYEYDDHGQLAASGNINKVLLHQLNNLNYYHSTYPKSLGLEWVNQNIFPLIDSFKLSVEDILRTFVAHIAFQIAEVLNTRNHSNTLVTGGGAYNSFLIECLHKQTASKIIIPDNKLIEYKEALIFGLLGILKLRDDVNCLSSVTGAKLDHSSGIIYYP